MQANGKLTDMIFLASKLLAFLVQPLAWVAMLLLISAVFVRRHPALARHSAFLALALLVVIGWEPLPDLLLRQLEAQYPPVAAATALDEYAGVIVLGGALESAHTWVVPGQSSLNDAAERMTQVLPLLQRHAHLRVLFTGGDGELFAGELSESERARRFFEQQLVTPERIRYEAASRTTYENAVMSYQIADVDTQRRWLLLTSAWHMPRAMSAFRRAGWQVTAYPVDYRGGVRTPWTHYSMDQGAKKWRIFLRETLGLLLYRLLGMA